MARGRGVLSSGRDEGAYSYAWSNCPVWCTYALVVHVWGAPMRVANYLWQIVYLRCTVHNSLVRNVHSLHAQYASVCSDRT